MFEVPWRSQRSARRHHDSGGAWAGRGKSTITRAPRAPATCPSAARDTSLPRLGVRAVDVLTLTTHGPPACFEKQDARHRAAPRWQGFPAAALLLCSNL